MIEIEFSPLAGGHVTHVYRKVGNSGGWWWWWTTLVVVVGGSYARLASAKLALTCKDLYVFLGIDAGHSRNNDDSDSEKNLVVPKPIG